MNGDVLAERIRELALAFPEAYEDHPWGDFPVFKVPPNKVFGFLGIEPKEARLTVKVTPEERDVALLLPFVSVARYVGRYGWITAHVTDEETLSAALEWLRESYWLKAPAKLRDAAWNQSA
jgi:predicted DNA-binding protein (MmcQ/YjbR family)